MENRRNVDKVLSVFDLTHCQGLVLPGGGATRVMLIYDKKENIKEFKVLNKKISKETSGKITSWLEKNIHLYEAIHGLGGEVQR